MNAARSWYVVLGSLGIGAAVALVANPAAAATLPIEGVAMDYLVVGALGVAVFASAMALFGLRSFGEVREARPPPVEAPAKHPPGDIVASTLDGLPRIRVTATHRQLHHQLRELTISAVVQRHHCSRVEARDRLRDGSWTDDAHAAEFLRSPALDPPSLTNRVVGRFVGRRWYQDRVVATVRALERLEGIDG